MGMGSPGSGGSGRTALGGILAAGSLALLWLASVTPSGRMGITALAGLFPVVSVLAAGRGAGYLCWGAAGLLGMILVPDKGVSALYLLFFGLYPVVKGRIESIRRPAPEWGLKLIFFNAALTLFWFLLRGLFLPNPPQWLGDSVPVLYGAGNAVFVCYDIGLSKLIALLRRRLSLDRRR